MPAVTAPGVFTPLWGGNTVNLAVTSTTGNVALPGRVSYNKLQVRLYNAGGATAFVNCGGSTVTASATTDIPIPAGAVEVMTLDFPATVTTPYIAAVTSAGTATLYITPGDGV